MFVLRRHRAWTGGVALTPCVALPPGHALRSLRVWQAVFGATGLGCGRQLLCRLAAVGGVLRAPSSLAIYVLCTYPPLLPL